MKLSIRVGWMLGMTALLAISATALTTIRANAATVSTKVVHVKRHDRLDLHGFHRVPAYTKTTRTKTYSGYTKDRGHGKSETETEPGYRRKYTVIKYDRQHPKPH